MLYNLMVKVCSYEYPKKSEEQYAHYYSKYSHPLYDFQKWCVEAIVEGHHVLACCPTGSGKTFGGEFALEHMFAKGKKTIYCSPIKALSNQKFYDFTKKYPDISVGLITGDIKTNPDADVLIMTTEILLNKLYQIKSQAKTAVSFDMDIQLDLGCVVFDEIHMINDAARGHVWEQSILLLPQHIQIVGLSATLDDPEKFAYWLEMRGQTKNESGKNVFLTRKLVRSVPLIHYSFLTTVSGVPKIIKDKVLQQEIHDIADKPFIIQNAKGEFNETQYAKTNKILNLFDKHNIRIKRQHVLNRVAEHLVQNEMLPALCYVFSRKQLERCAQEMTTNLLEFDSKVPYTVDRECEQIIRKLPNYQEYLHLPEYQNMVQLLRKGVGMHHAGLMPVLREMVELLFAKGFIKILFCTETMSVGINLPVKTTIFTEVSKYDGVNNRMLLGHEYTQAAGRAGRLGLDKVGHVIHLNNLFRDVEPTNYRVMMKGSPQKLTSKFKISYNLLLNLIDIGDTNLIDFSRKSMMTNEIDSHLGDLLGKINLLEQELDNTKVIQTRTPVEVVEEYYELCEKKQGLANKKRKDVERQIQEILDEYKHFETDKQILKKFIDKRSELTQLQSQFDHTEKYIDNNVLTILQLLIEQGFVSSESVVLTKEGIIASQLREVHCLVFSKLVSIIETLTAQQMVVLFSCFTNVSTADEFKDSVPKTADKQILGILKSVEEMYDFYLNKESKVLKIDSGMDYTIHYDLINYVDKWCLAADENECKLVLQQLNCEKHIFLGEFVKALLKVNNISCEFEKIAELTGNVAFLSKLKEIPTMTLKFVVTNQSLYV
jgi:superfamily II RNA helicase